VTEIAGFYDRIMEDEHLNNPEFGACELFEAAAKNLPLKIDHNKKQEALEAISSEDENIQSVGKRAFQFLSLNTILAVVNENYDRKIDSKEDGDEMFMEVESATASKGEPDAHREWHCQRMRILWPCCL